MSDAINIEAKTADEIGSLLADEHPALCSGATLREYLDNAGANVFRVRPYGEDNTECGPDALDSGQQYIADESRCGGIYIYPCNNKADVEGAIRSAHGFMDRPAQFIAEVYEC